MGGVTLTALEWSIYDRWLGARRSRPASPALLVVARDPDSEARFGAGAWDRAVLARLVTNLSRAGAAAVGLDVPLAQPSPPGRGGASSDALLGQATALAGRVVYPIALEPASQAAAVPGLAAHARAVGHTVVSPDPDGVVRRVPLFVRVEDRAVPAFGLALAAVYMNVGSEQIVDGQDRVLVDYAGADGAHGLTSLPFLTVWTAIETGQTETLRDLVDGKIVLVLAGPPRPPHRTPLGPMSDIAIHAHVLDAVLAGARLSEAPAGWALAGTFVVAVLAGWLWLARRWWKALLGVAALVAAYAVTLPLSLVLTGVVLPVALPMAAVLAASAGALLWNHLASTRRIRHLEGENASAREALVRHESTVEALEEDLEAARAAVARSTGAERELGRAADALRAQLADARAQEEQTRQRLEALDRELGELRPAEGGHAVAADAEQERLRRASAQVGIVTRDPGVLAVFRDLEKAARSSLPILLVGEPGTGKELFARAAHRLSPRRADQPFVAVNMAAISAELFESELFGHVKGGFTGAVGDRKGYFEQADRGTLFLDEVGELRPDHQSKLLRALQERSFHRVGATRPTAVDVRVVAASNRDLERGVAEGWFREDLYFRLKGLVLRLPPLRERRDDVPLLAVRFVGDAAAEVGRPGLALSEAAVLALEHHRWPGNVRELQHCLRQAAALAEDAVITTEDLRLPSSGPGTGSSALDVVDGDAGSDTAVLACLRRHAFDMQATARALGWDRSTVTQRLKGLGFRALVEAEGDRASAAQMLAGDPALARTVELKVREYHEHLLRAIQGFDSRDAAVSACRRRFKNLPERHFRSLEFLVRQHFDRRQPTARV